MDMFTGRLTENIWILSFATTLIKFSRSILVTLTSYMCHIVTFDSTISRILHECSCFIELLKRFEEKR